MRPEAPCTVDHMERDLNIVVHVQHYENMETTRPPANNLRELFSWCFTGFHSEMFMASGKQVSCKRAFVTEFSLCMGQMLADGRFHFCFLARCFSSTPYFHALVVVG